MGIVDVPDLPPSALYMILSDDVVFSDNWPRKPLIVGLTTLVKWHMDLEPMLLDKLTAF